MITEKLNADPTADINVVLTESKNLTVSAFDITNINEINLDFIENMNVNALKTNIKI